MNSPRTTILVPQSSALCPSGPNLICASGYALPFAKIRLQLVTSYILSSQLWYFMEATAHPHGEQT